MNAVIAALILGGMALLFGLVLTFVAKVFAVPHDKRRDHIREALPGANCAGCGYPSCDACADAIAAGKAPAHACTVGGEESAEKIADILGIELDHSPSRMVALVRCRGYADNVKMKFDYTGIEDCVAASVVNEGYKACKFACLGLGTCARACKFDAMHIDPVRKIAKVDETKCTGCGTCASVCPRNVITLHPANEPFAVMCRNTDKGKQVMDVCKSGCITCGKCVRGCPYGAITMKGTLPEIDRSKCQKCFHCVEACPTGAIHALLGSAK